MSNQLTESQLSKVEEAVIALSEALQIPEEKIIDILENGMKDESAKILEGNMLPKFQYCIDELRVTFNHW